MSWKQSLQIRSETLLDQGSPFVVSSHSKVEDALKNGPHFPLPPLPENHPAPAPTGWQPWFQIHPETVFNKRSPVVISRNPNQVDVFKIGFDNAVWSTFWNPVNGWHPWFQIHPETVFDNENGHVTAVSRNPDQIDLFTTGFDGAVWSTFWDPSNGWNKWFQIHPETVFNQSTPVTAISRNANQLDLFKIGFDGAVWTTFWNPANGWNAWFQIHPETKFDINGTVTAISRNHDQIDLFVTGFDGAVWSTFWNPANGWNAWFQIHPETVFNQQSPISAISRNPDQLDLFKVGFDGAIWSTFWNPANGWNAWFQIHPETKFDVDGTVTAISRNPNQIDLFVTGFDRTVWSTFWNPANGWNAWFQIHPETVFNPLTPVTCLARTPDHIDLFRIGFDNALWSTWWELECITLSKNITTEGIDAFGASIEVTIYRNGNIRFKGHAHNSGLEDYDFNIRAIVQCDSPIVLALQKSGSVEGTRHDIFGKARRDFDWDETTFNPNVAACYDDLVKNIRMDVHSHNSGDISGALESIANFAIKWIAGAALINPVVGMVIFVGVEIGSLATGGGFVGGAKVIGHTLWFAGPWGTLYAIAAEAIATIGENERTLHEDEYAFANHVFKGTLPPRENIILTDTIGGNDRPFCMPRFDGKVTINMGKEVFNDPRKFHEDWVSSKTGEITKYGQTFIHELTHAWQIQNSNWDLSLMASALASRVCELAGSDPYDYGKDPNKPFGEYNLEQQANIVDTWFSRCYDKHSGIFRDDTNSPLYHYIENNIRIRKTS